MSDSVRYDFSWTVQNGGSVKITLTRNEWPAGYSVTTAPHNISKCIIIAGKNYVGFKPVPPAQTFKALPENEHEHIKSIARAIYAAVNRIHELHHWEGVPS